MITFVLSMFLYLGGVLTDPANNAPPTENVSEVTGLITGHQVTVFKPDSWSFSAGAIIVDLVDNGISSSIIWTALIALIAIIAVGITVNAVTGGNASVGITLGLSVFVWWAVGIAGDFIALVHRAKSINCAAITPCTDPFYWMIWVFGVILTIGFVYSLFDLVAGND
jgi:hypothetical protein